MLPIYKISVDENDYLGLTAVSFVDSPAIDIDFVYFSKEKSLFFSHDEKREVVSPILIPEQLIYRIAEDGTPYYMKWTEEVIRECAQRYLSNQFNNNVTIMHPQFYDSSLSYEDVLEDDVFLIKMWIIESDNDEANTVYGFNHLPKGTLMVHYKVLNEELWQRIKSGELRGLSIEATASLKKINFNKENKKMTLFEKITEFLNSISDEVKELEDVAKKDNTESAKIDLKFLVNENEETYITVDSEGIARNNKTMEALQQGEYLLADGNILVVDADSKFVETRPQEEATVEEPIEAPIAEEKVEEEMPIQETAEEEKKEEATEDEPTEDVEKVDESEVEVVEEINEEKVEEDVEENKRVEVKINESAYKIEEEVANHINTLLSEISSKEDEIKLLRERLSKLERNTPSVEPLQPMINQSNDFDYSEIVDRLNRYKH